MAVGCATTEAPAPSGVATTTASPSPRPYRAVLDWTNATIELPLDHFGMSLREQQVVTVAASVAFARCANPDHSVGDWALSEARRYLSREPDATHWLFGYWSVEYAGRHGLEASAVHAPVLVDTDMGTAARCSNESEYFELEPISASTWPATDVSGGILTWSGEAYERTLADHRVEALVREVNACVAASGLPLDEEPGLGGVALDPGWSAEQQLDAVRTEARCRDDANFTQSVADIAAEYQQELIVVHLDELLALRRTATQRVARATEILREAGLV